MTGYGIALLFLVFGAPDLAMTQFAIETLSVSSSSRSSGGCRG